MRILLLALCLACCGLTLGQGAIYTGSNSGSKMQYAALELQRYLFQSSGTLLSVNPGSTPTGIAFILGTPSSLHGMLPPELLQGIDTLGVEGYRLQTRKNKLYIIGNTPAGCLYGVYGLLEDHYNFRFYACHTQVPSKKPLAVPHIDESLRPKMKIRGFLP